VTNLARPAERAVAFSNQRSTAEQRIREGFLLQFRGSSITSDAGLLAYRELDVTLQLTDTGADNWRTRAPVRTVGTGWRGCCANRYSGDSPATKDVNDAKRRCRDPAMRRPVGDRAIVEIEPQSALVRFTRWVSHSRPGRASADPPQDTEFRPKLSRRPSNLARHPGNVV